MHLAKSLFTVEATTGCAFKMSVALLPSSVSECKNLLNLKNAFSPLAIDFIVREDKKY